jgi:hypothetical protein
MATGGRRDNAGRPAQRELVERCFSIDVRTLARRGLLVGSATPELLLLCREGNPATKWTYVEFQRGKLQVAYKEHGVSCCAEISIEYTAGQFGGCRPWFRCPQCERRSALLYLGPLGFSCRVCRQLNYASQRLGICGKSWARQRVLEGQLGERCSRPKWMRSARYRHLMAEIVDCIRVREEWLAWAMGTLRPELDRLTEHRKALRSLRLNSRPHAAPAGRPECVDIDGGLCP